MRRKKRRGKRKERKVRNLKVNRKVLGLLAYSMIFSGPPHFK